jgi:hypothetical protein
MTYSKAVFKPQFHFINIEHNLGCPSVCSLRMVDCTCDGDVNVKIVTESEYLATLDVNRQARRKAARATASAVNRAMRRGGL